MGMEAIGSITKGTWVNSIVFGCKTRAIEKEKSLTNYIPSGNEFNIKSGLVRHLFEVKLSKKSIPGVRFALGCLRNPEKWHTTRFPLNHWWAFWAFGYISLLKTVDNGLEVRFSENSRSPRHFEWSCVRRTQPERLHSGRYIFPLHARSSEMLIKMEKDAILLSWSKLDIKEG